MVVYDRTPAEKIIERINDAQIILTNKTVLTKQILQKTPSVKYIGVMATGYNVVDIIAAKELGITVTNVPAYSTNSVAQLVFAIMLELCHHVGEHNRAVHDGAWTNSVDFTFWNYPLIELANKTLGIIGFGGIGQATARIAAAFGMKVIVYNRTKRPELETDKIKLQLLKAKNCIITPHFAWAPFEARTRLMDTLIKNIKAFIDDMPVNVVNS